MVSPRVAQFVRRGNRGIWLRLSRLETLFNALHLVWPQRQRAGGRSIGRYMLTLLRSVYSFGQNVVEVEGGEVEIETEKVQIEVDYSTTGGRCAGTRIGRITNDTVVYLHHSLLQEDRLMEALNLHVGDEAARRREARAEAQRRADAEADADAEA
jgi:hypothetical protein